MFVYCFRLANNGLAPGFTGLFCEVDGTLEGLLESVMELNALYLLLLEVTFVEALLFGSGLKLPSKAVGIEVLGIPEENDELG